MPALECQAEPYLILGGGDLICSAESIQVRSDLMAFPMSEFASTKWISLPHL